MTQKHLESRICTERVCSMGEPRAVLGDINDFISSSPCVCCAAWLHYIPTRYTIYCAHVSKTNIPTREHRDLYFPSRRSVVIYALARYNKPPRRIYRNSSVSVCHSDGQWKHGVSVIFVLCTRICLL